MVKKRSTRNTTNYMKNKKRFRYKIKKLLCWILGHNIKYVMEVRTRVHGKKGTRFGSYLISLNRKGGKGGYTTNTVGGYYTCARCGRKLTHFKARSGK